MRIQMHYSTTVSNPCATLNKGEVEDYTLNISGGSGLIATADLNQVKLINGLSVFPNPVTSSYMRLDYTLAKQGNITFRLADASGLILGNYKAGLQNKGANSYLINNLSALHNGYYYVSVEQDGIIIGRLTVLIAH